MAFPNDGDKFKKGQSGNPKGRPPKLVSSVLKELESNGHERVNKGAVRDVYEYLIGLNQDELTKLGNDKKTPMLFRIVAKNILSKKGFEIIEKMLDRAHGKAVQSTNIGNENGDAFKIVLIDASEQGDDTKD